MNISSSYSNQYIYQFYPFQSTKLSELSSLIHKDGNDTLIIEEIVAG